MGEGLWCNNGMDLVFCFTSCHTAVSLGSLMHEVPITILVCFLLV